MIITKHGAGPWPKVTAANTLLTIEDNNGNAMQLDCAALQTDQQATIDVVYDRNGGLVTGAENGVAYVANVIIPAAKYNEVLSGAMADENGEVVPAETVIEKIPFAASGMAAVKVALWTIPATNPENTEIM